MSDEKIYAGRGNASMHDEYIDFINYVFGFNGRDRDFPKLLPKLYRREDDPAGNSYVVTENGRIRAAVGAFDHTMTVCGRELRCRSIGNVAAHPYDKSRGFMRKLMDMAVEDMVRDGIAISTLGGKRQRYNYFSYEKSGTTYRFSVNSDNMRHTFGTDRTAHHRFDVRALTADDTASLDAIAEQEIFNRYYELSKGKISIFVSHRLSSAVTAGKIIVLGGGEIVECGSHDELMAAKGEYYRLFTTQAQNYIGGSEQ